MAALEAPSKNFFLFSMPHIAGIMGYIKSHWQEHGIMIKQHLRENHHAGKQEHKDRDTDIEDKQKDDCT